MKKTSKIVDRYNTMHYITTMTITHIKETDNMKHFLLSMTFLFLFTSGALDIINTSKRTHDVLAKSLKAKTLNRQPAVLK